MFRQVGAGFALALAAWLGGAASAQPGLPPETVERITEQVRPGDLIFKGASTAVWTELAARWSTGDKRWGHVGIVTRVPEACCDPVMIVHADTGTGNPDNKPAPGEVIGEVRAVPIAQFLSDVDQTGLFRLDLAPDQRERLVTYAETAAASRTPFDRGYSLDSPNNLYCTELVWRAMSAALETDAIPQKSQSMGRIYIALSDLSLHPRAQEVLATETPH